MKVMENVAKVHFLVHVCKCAEIRKLPLVNEFFPTPGIFKTLSSTKLGLFQILENSEMSNSQANLVFAAASTHCRWLRLS